MKSPRPFLSSAPGLKGVPIEWFRVDKKVNAIKAGIYYMDVKEAKKMRDWLDKAIAYLEGK